MYFYHMKWGKRGWRHTPSPRVPMGWFRGGTLSLQSHLPVSSPTDSSSTIGRGHSDQGRVRLSSTNTQTEGRSGYHPFLKLLQDNNWVRTQLEYELIQEAQELAKRYNHKQVKQAQRHARQWAQLVDQTDATFQKVFIQASSMEAFKLLP